MRPAVPGDLDTLVELEQLCEGAGAWSPALIADSLSSSTTANISNASLPESGGWSVRWLLDDHGYAVVAVVDDVAELQRIGTRPDHRRAGHARRMLAAALQHARRAGAERILLEVRESNAPARSLYHSTGFTEISSRRRYYADGETAVVMELVL